MTRILIVDDEKTIRKLLERIATRAGFEVDVARDGLEALEMLGRQTYDIAIVDLMMPRLSGYDLVQQISTMNPRPTVIVATAMMNGDAASLDDSMVRRVIKKPFDINAVAAALVETARQIADERNSPSPPIVVLDDAAVNAVESTDEKTPAAPKDPTPPKQGTS
ncbi:MAG TPA: response regulator [Thermoanaerobaculia bacterium]|nr:response regulator [Thermoanaerobaculia bacterium]